MIDSGRVPGKARIHVITEKLSEPVPENGRIWVSTGKRENLGEYREKIEYVRLPKTIRTSIGKIVESGSVPENDRIRASTGKR